MKQKFNPTPEYLTFIAKLRLARMFAQISQRELARRVGIHHSRVVRSEAQPPQRPLDIAEAKAWITALGVPLADFKRELEMAFGTSATPMHGISLRGDVALSNATSAKADAE